MSHHDPNLAVSELADRFWEGVLERDPITATIYGDDRYDERWPDLGPNGRAAERAALTQALAEAEAIDPASLDVESVITRDLLILIAQNYLEAQDRKLYQLAVNHMSGVQTWPSEIAQYQRVDTEVGLDRLLARYAAFSGLIDQHIETLDEGIADGRTSPAVPVRKAIEQIDRMLTVPADVAPPVVLANVADESGREAIRASVATDLYPALQKLRDYLAETYTPHAAATPGISDTPNGHEAYGLCIRMQTTVAATPEEVHAFGMEDLEKIEAEKDEIARRQGHADRHAFNAALAEDPANRTSDPAHIIELAREQTDRAYATAPRYFGRLPAANCVVLPVEEYRERESAPAFYMPPTLDGSRPGQYYLNTYQPDQRQLHKIASITFHEATPGHHFQIAIEMDLQGLGRFRTIGAKMAGSAYVEGWGLYTERLADEMDLYQTDAERLGMLDAQSFRAARLVVDSGLHAMGWTRDRAITFMHERGSLPMVDAEIEVDRYTIWPGQALSYKMGQREIERAREDVKERLGDRFDLRAFHDEVLGHGSLPLETLRREIPGWVAAAVTTPSGA
ncbi:MAG TPA: DUF885 domain-containing protein [Candidatus Limnocylindria bacterium]